MAETAVRLRDALRIGNVTVHTGTGNVTVVNEGVVVVLKASGAATGVTLPAVSERGYTIIIKDGKGDAATNNITVTPTSDTIDGAATYVIDENYGWVILQYNGSEWGVIGKAPISDTELGFLDGVTAGTGAASKALVLDASGNVIMPDDGVLGLSRAAVAAAGVDATDATVIADQVAAVTGADGAKGVALPAAATTEGPILVINTSATAALKVYPVNGGNDQINALAEDAAFTMGPGTASWFIPTSATQWYAAQTAGSTFMATAGNVGTANTGTTAVEEGDAIRHRTTLTVNTTLPAIAGGADLAVGKLLYTMPAGTVVIHSAKMSLAITQTQGNITADTPDGGLGSVIGSGVVATLDGTATFEDILTGQTFNNCNGTAETKTVADQPMVMETGAAHTVHFNVADGWAASGDAAATLVGTVILEWSFLG